MFENRSFDNLLGRLYEPGEVVSFEGVTGKERSNPIPAWAEHGAGRKVVPYGVAASMDAPNPDPGEEFPHVNTQLFPGRLRRARRQLRPRPAAPGRPAGPGRPARADGSRRRRSALSLTLVTR